ncbi:MAG: FHA domain-containing protein [Planctomycetaceae bacterium]
MSQISVRVCDEVHGVEKVYQLQQPYAILGPGSGSDVSLPAHASARPRRFYLQAVDAGVVAVELASRPPAGVPVSARLIDPDNPLRIGSFAVMAERSFVNGQPVTRNVPDGKAVRFANRLMEDTWLYFVNGHSRTTRKSVRHLRETLTLIGRSKCCHLKLSHPRVSRFQCSIVRCGEEFWAVALSRRNELRVNGHPVRNSRLTVGDILSVGPFRLQLQQGVRPGSSPCLMVNGDADAAEDDSSAQENHKGTTLSERPLDASLSHDASLEWETVRCASDSDVISLVEQFTSVQQLLMAQSQQQASMLLHLIRNVQSSQESQQYLLREQIAAIQGISDELQAWRADLEQQAVAVPPRLIESRMSELPKPEGSAAIPAAERVPKTAAEIRAHASLSERINFLERERKSIVQKIIRLLPGNSEADR